MKIFSWVHRRFHQKDEVSQDAKKAEFTGIDNKKQALRENAAMPTVFDGWKEGILAIGTLGIDPLKDFKPKDDHAYMHNQVSYEDDEEDEDEDKDEDEDGEMEYPLVLKASKHGFNHVEDSPCDHEVAKPKPNNGAKDVKKVIKRGERITLADLLRADSGKKLLKNNKLSHDDDYVKVHYYDSIESIKKHDANADGVSFIPKKMNKKVTKDDPVHLIKKTNRLMRKMLKRKIHPDIGSQKKESAGTMKPFMSLADK